MDSVSQLNYWRGRYRDHSTGTERQGGVMECDCMIKEEHMKNIKIIPYRKRVFKIPVPAKKHFANDDDLYDWMINTWIVKQPDCDALMQLFIRCKFDLNKFLVLIIDKPPNGTRKRKAA